MGRPKRAAEGGGVYHVLNRSNARMPIFENDRDYEAFEKILGEAVKRTTSTPRSPEETAKRSLTPFRPQWITTKVLSVGKPFKVN